MDTISLRIDPDLYVSWPNGGGFQQVEIRINDVPLIEIVREVEFPFACAEWDERTAKGEKADDIGERGWLAGNYLYLPPSQVLPPSRNFFGEPYANGFRTDPDDPVNTKSLLLSCTCGITDCWFLLATITVRSDTMTWSDFQQFHRDWEYKTLRFVFDRTQYAAAFENATEHITA
jgi:hypothetical protein